MSHAPPSAPGDAPGACGSDPTAAAAHGGPRLALDLPVVLPEVEDSRDRCVGRLLEHLAGLRGITSAHLDDRDAESRLCLHYDPDLVTLGQVERLAHDAGAHLTARYGHDTLRITDMDCGDCAQSIEHVVGRMAGVTHVAVSYAAELMHVEFDTAVIGRAEIVARLRSMGYSPRPRDVEPTGWIARHSELARSAASGVLLGAGIAAEAAGLPAALWGPIYAASYVAGGLELARHGFAAVVRGSFTVDLLMSVAALGAAALGRWADGGLLLFLFSLGHALEEEAMERARGAITALGKLAPRSARVLRDGIALDLAVEEIRRGDRVVVRSGERIPVDGLVRAGCSDVDESPITGESLPVAKQAGATVFAGSVNGDGSLQIEVTKLATETTLARVVHMVAEAETQKSPTQRLVDRFAHGFVPAMLAGVALLAVLPPILDVLSWREAFLRAMAVLVAASPCALAIATPAATLSAIACAARLGVLIKGGVHLESLGALRAVAFDKTGTITRGRPRVTDVVPLAGTTAEQLLACAAAVEQHATHPLARAIVAHAREHGIAAPEAVRVDTLAGLGVRGEVDGDEVCVGSTKLHAERGSPLPAAVADLVEEIQERGRTAMLVSRAGHLLGLVALADQPREGAAAVLARLRTLGIHQLVMLTGDQPRVAQAIAAQVDLHDVRSGLLPEDKLAAVRELMRHGGGVAMVGDGINDAPALAAATVGIAMGAAGTDVALETADVALMADDLAALPFAIALGRRTRRVVRQNLMLAFTVIALLVPLSALGVAGIGSAIVLHEGSTLLVVANALRLLQNGRQRARMRLPFALP